VRHLQLSPGSKKERSRDSFRASNTTGTARKLQGCFGERLNLACTASSCQWCASRAFRSRASAGRMAGSHLSKDFFDLIKAIGEAKSKQVSLFVCVPATPFLRERAPLATLRLSAPHEVIVPAALCTNSLSPLPPVPCTSPSFSFPRLFTPCPLPNPTNALAPGRRRTASL
jgi:hypothetical protein